MTEPPRPPDDRSGQDGSAPWERPRRWDRRGLDATRVDDLLARLGADDETTGRRSRRRQAAQDEAPQPQRGEATPDPASDQPATGAIPASELIAALAGDRDTTRQDATPDDWPAQDSSPDGRPAQADQDTAGPDTAGPDTDATSLLPRTTAAAPAPPTTDATGTDATGTDATGTAPAGPPSLALQPPRRPAGSTAAGSTRGAADDDTDHPTQEIPQYSLEEVASIRESLRAQAPAAATGAEPPGTPPPPPARAGRSGDGGEDHHRRRPLLVAGRSAIAALAAVLLLFTGYDWVVLERAEAGLENNRDVVTLPADTRTSGPTGTEASTVQPTNGGAPVVVYKPENILLLGSDSRSGDNGDAGNSDASTEGSANSDTMLLMHISGDRQSISVLSFPRFLQVPAPSCRTWDFTTRKQSNTTYPVTDSSRWRISNAYAVGGPACSVAAVSKLTGIHIDRVIDIDFHGFKAMVDALDGVVVNVCRPIVDRELQTVVAVGGVQKISGDQALSLVRARKVIGDPTGTDGRMRRQQVVLSAMLRQLTTAKVLLNPNQLNDFLTAFLENTHTVNVTVDSMLQLARQLSTLPPDRVNFYSVPHTQSPTEQDTELLDPSAQPIFAAIRNDERLPTFTSGGADGSSAPTTPPGSTRASTSRSTGAATTAPSTPESTPESTEESTAPQTLSVDPAGIDLQVVNETGRAGVATDVMTTLNGGGFRISEEQLLRPESETTEATTVQYSGAENRAAAVMVAAAVPGSSLQPVDGLGSRVRLVLGTSFDGTVTPAAVGDPVPERLQTTPSSTPRPTPTSTPKPTTGAPADGSGSATPTTSAVPTATIDTSKVSAVNAGDSTCA